MVFNLFLLTYNENKDSLLSTLSTVGLSSPGLGHGQAVEGSQEPVLLQSFIPWTAEAAAGLPIGAFLAVLRIKVQASAPGTLSPRNPRNPSPRNPTGTRI